MIVISNVLGVATTVEENVLGVATMVENVLGVDITVE